MNLCEGCKKISKQEKDILESDLTDWYSNTVSPITILTILLELRKDMSELDFSFDLIPTYSANHILYQAVSLSLTFN